jgi:hypothetical protein
MDDDDRAVQELLHELIEEHRRLTKLFADLLQATGRESDDG